MLAACFPGLCMCFLAYVARCCHSLSSRHVTAGGLNGAFHIAKDSCLYVETFVINTAVGKATNGTKVSTALEYYFGQVDIAADNVPYQIYGINTDQLYDGVNSPAAQIFLGYLDTAVGQAFVTNTTQLNSTEQNEVLALPTMLNQINSSIKCHPSVRCITGLKTSSAVRSQMYCTESGWPGL